MNPASIPSPGFDQVQIGPLAFHVYGLMYVLAIVAAVAITRRRWIARGGDGELVLDVAIWGVPVGLVGARLYHVITSPEQLPDAWWGPLAVWEGGLGVWGGIAAGALAGVLVLRYRGANVASFLDAAAPALLVAQSIGRIGNYFNQELFGRPSDLPWSLEIEVSARPEEYVNAATFHPMFLYEICWNLALAAFLVWLGKRGRIRPPGLFALYVAGYSLGRIWAELLRVDPSAQVLGMRLNFFVASALFAAGAIWFAVSQRSSGQAEPGPA